LKAGIFEFRRKGHHLGVELGISTVLSAFSLTSIIVLLQIDALAQKLNSHGLPFIIKYITPYWIAINAVLGAFWLVTIAAILFKMYVLPRKRHMT
jgi:hypothetical protein